MGTVAAKMLFLDGGVVLSGVAMVCALLRLANRNLGLWGSKKCAPGPVTRALRRCGFVLVDQAAEDGLAANLRGTFAGDGA